MLDIQWVFSSSASAILVLLFIAFLLNTAIYSRWKKWNWKTKLEWNDSIFLGWLAEWQGNSDVATAMNLLSTITSTSALRLISEEILVGRISPLSRENEQTNDKPPILLFPSRSTVGWLHLIIFICGISRLNSSHSRTRVRVHLCVCHHLNGKKLFQPTSLYPNSSSSNPRISSWE